MKYLALLRGVNVGGKNIIKMSELKVCFEHSGLNEVVTFIQTGNVLFKTDEPTPVKLTEVIEGILSKNFNYDSWVIVVSQKQLKTIVKCAPEGFGKDPSRYRYEVIFLKGPLSSAKAMKVVTVKEGVDFVSAGSSILYVARPKEKLTQSWLPRLISSPMYGSMTVRSWRQQRDCLA